MDQEKQLKEKALLLLRRERELFGMRTKHEQVTLWLRLTQLLPKLFDRTLPIHEIYERLRKDLLTGLRLQRVIFLEIGPQTLAPIAPPGLAQPLTPELAAFLAARPSGVCNGVSDSEADGAARPDPGVSHLAQAVGLKRFLWSEIRVARAAPVLLVAGFDERTAKFQNPFDDSDAAHLENVAQHVQTLLGNLFLLNELEREKDSLQRANQNLELRDRALQTASEQLRAANESLERRVSERTLALAQRTRDMRLVLDNVDQAFLTIGADGRLAHERSAMVDRWFGPFEGQPRFVDYIAAVDRGFAEGFELAYEALLEDVLPIDLCIDQLPARLRSQSRELSCSYSPLPGEAGFSGLLIVISDVTEKLRRARAEGEQTELLALFQGLLRDRAGYLAFVDEAGQIVERLTAPPFDLRTTRRLLHTLKGTASMAGANVIASLCHQAEDQLDEDEAVPPTACLEQLAKRLGAVRQELTSILGEHGRGSIEVPWQDVQDLADEVRRGAAANSVLARLARWQSEPVQLPLGRLAQYARALATRLGKGDLQDTVSAPDVRFDPHRWGPLWSALTQTVRNAIDHGIEPSAERIARGKPAVARFELRLRRQDAHWLLELEDDGRGIDWDRVRTVAIRRGLPHGSHDQLVAALFSPEFSTRSSVTSTSGRGVGMAVVRAHVLALGGTVAVTSHIGKSCCWRIAIPINGVGAAASQAR
jgi:HPt (histidine-containing phosphotransfer) domain-containing protein/Skp family chaperone for outer membrane proteins